MNSNESNNLGGYSIFELCNKLGESSVDTRCVWRVHVRMKEIV